MFVTEWLKPNPLAFMSSGSGGRGNAQQQDEPILKADAHNIKYGGFYLGDHVTAEQYAAISEGTFDGLFVGDYWAIDGINYRIAHFDYFINCGDTPTTAHHTVVVPDTCLYIAQMNNTSSGAFTLGENTTAGGYVGSDMYKTNLARAKATINSAFSGHIMTHREYLMNDVANGMVSAGLWLPCEVELMSERMVFGCNILSPVSNGSSVPINYFADKTQFALFAHDPSRIVSESYWLRDVVSPTSFARVSYEGTSGYGDSSRPYRVRPYFCIS